MKKSRAFMVIPLLSSVVALAQSFRIESVMEVASGPVASRFTNSNFSSSAVGSYDAVENTCATRLSGARVNIGHARNELFAYDMKAGRELWTRYLDAPLVHFVQTPKLAIALSYASLYAFEIEKGSLLWQLSLDTLKDRNPARLSRALRNWTWPNQEAMDKDLALYGRHSPLVAYQAEGDSVWLWPGKGPIVRILAASGMTVTTMGDPGESPYSALASSGAYIAALQRNRLLSIVNTSSGKTVCVHLPEPFASDVTLLGVPGRRGAFLARTYMFSAIWDSVSGDLKLLEEKTGKKGLIHVTDRGIYGHVDEGLVRVPFDSAPKKVTFGGNTITAWLLLIPFTASCVVYPYAEIRVGGTCFLPVWQGDALWLLDAETLKPIQELKIPGFTSDGMLMMMSMVRGAYIPPYYDYANKKAYFVFSQCADKAPNEKIQPEVMKDYLVTLAW